MIEERRATHRERYNKDKLACTLKVGDVVKAHIQVQSLTDKEVVTKLSYRDKDCFIITKDLGHNSFEVQRYDNPTSTKLNHKSPELYLLPPALFLSQPLDIIDQRYLNSTHVPIINLLMK